MQTNETVLRRTLGNVTYLQTRVGQVECRQILALGGLYHLPPLGRICPRGESILDALTTNEAATRAPRDTQRQKKTEKKKKKKKKKKI